jgi:O-succinylbenzoic acid--CoA ligase
MQVEAWLQRAASSAPALTALQTPRGRLSYAELAHAAHAGASELAERGARRGERVAIALAPGAEFAQALHACMLLGAVAVPVDPRLTPEEREPIVAGSVLVERSLRTPAPGELEPQRGRSALTHDLDAVCAVIQWSALGSSVALGVDPHERWLCALPLSHVGGLSILVRSAIYATTVVIHERFDTGRVLAALEEQDITIVSLVSTTLARLLDAGLRDPPALRCALTGGGPVPAALLERAHAAGVPAVATYGLTEACSQVTTGGPPLFCTRVELDEDGEILVDGPTVAHAARSPDGWLHTGDLGDIDAHGFLRVSGRKADTIISGGENVAPSEVEAVLEAHPGVIEAAVLGRDDPRWGEVVIAIVVASPQASVGEGVLRDHCAARLASFKVPKQVRIVSEPLPRTASGKLLRRELEGISI